MDRDGSGNVARMSPDLTRDPAHGERECELLRAQGGHGDSGQAVVVDRRCENSGQVRDGNGTERASGPESD